MTATNKPQTPLDALDALLGQIEAQLLAYRFDELDHPETADAMLTHGAVLKAIYAQRDSIAVLKTESLLWALSQKTLDS